MSQTKPETRKPSKTLTRITAAVLTVAFLAFMFAAFGSMMVQNW